MAQGRIDIRIVCGRRRPPIVEKIERVCASQPDGTVLNMRALAEQVGVGFRYITNFISDIDPKYTTKCAYRGVVIRVFGNPRSIAKINESLQKRQSACR